jgi:hypothetical protein
MAPIGIRFNYISVLNRPRIPDAIQDAINEAIESALRSLSLSGWQSLLKEPEQRRPMALRGALIKDRLLPSDEFRRDTGGQQFAFGLGRGLEQ